MAQNRSSAVMQQCHDRADVLNYYPTQPWATRALCEFLQRRYRLSVLSALEPACGEGHMALPLAEYFERVTAGDVADYRATFQEQDYISDFLISWDGDSDQVDFVITNPPFVLAEEFVQEALRRCAVGCAMFVRSAFLEGGGRHARLFSVTPPTFILQFTERVPLVKGRLDPEASTATAYAWVIWLKNCQGPTHFHWIAPCRARLERASDYPGPEQAANAGPLFGGEA